MLALPSSLAAYRGRARLSNSPCRSPVAAPVTAEVESVTTVEDSRPYAAGSNP